MRWWGWARPKGLSETRAPFGKLRTGRRGTSNRLTTSGWAARAEDWIPAEDAGMTGGCRTAGVGWGRWVRGGLDPGWGRRDDGGDDGGG